MCARTFAYIDVLAAKIEIKIPELEGTFSFKMLSYKELLVTGSRWDLASEIAQYMCQNTKPSASYYELNISAGPASGLPRTESCHVKILSGYKKYGNHCEVNTMREYIHLRHNDKFKNLIPTEKWS